MFSYTQSKGKGGLLRKFNGLQRPRLTTHRFRHLLIDYPISGLHSVLFLVSTIRGIAVVVCACFS